MSIIQSELSDLQITVGTRIIATCRLMAFIRYLHLRLVIPLLSRVTLRNAAMAMLEYNIWCYQIQQKPDDISCWYVDSESPLHPRSRYFRNQACQEIWRLLTRNLWHFPAASHKNYFVLLSHSIKQTLLTFDHSHALISILYMGWQGGQNYDILSHGINLCCWHLPSAIICIFVSRPVSVAPNITSNGRWPNHRFSWRYSVSNFTPESISIIWDRLRGLAYVTCEVRGWWMVMS